MMPGGGDLQQHRNRTSIVEDGKPIDVWMVAARAPSEVLVG
jgi:hypothetical protein